MTQYTPLISIVVPVYNVEAYIDRCLESIASQSYRNIEVIIVDDRGSDNSIDKCQDFIKRTEDNRFRIFRNPQNRGLSGARNAGLKESEGEYVYFLDSDDYISADCISNLARALTDYRYDVVIGNYSMHTGETEETASFGRPAGPVFGNAEILSGYRNGEWYVMAWNKLCRRKFLIDNGLWFEEGLLHEDVVWSFKLFSFAESICLIDSVCYHYIVREQSIMTGMSIEKDINIYLKVFETINSFIHNHFETIPESAYQLVEGKKSGILYSLLENREMDLYRKYYPEFHKQRLISPITAYRKGIIGFAYFVRDFGYCLPAKLGSIHKQLFFNLVYRWRGRSVQGKVWKK